MKHMGLALLGFSIFSFGQSTQQPVDVQRVAHNEIAVSNTPTAEDMYCSGFITTQRVSEAHHVVGGPNSPYQARWGGASDRVFIRGTADIKPGDRLQILRPVREPNRYENYSGESRLLRNTGQPYFERGYVRVLDVQKDIAITMPELSCADIIPGDLAVPFVEREKPVLHDVTLERFTPPNGKATGRIVMANEFDSIVGTTQKVYLSIGEDKGLKVGDYLRVTRSYDYKYRELESGLASKATEVDLSVYKPHKMFEMPKIPKVHDIMHKPGADVKDFPRLTLGDVIVLSVHRRSATAMVITALEDIHTGDTVEVMDANDAPAPAAPTGTQ
jgi:hypothetical protein